MIKTVLFSLIIVLVSGSPVPAQQNDRPLQVGIIGLVHTHVHWLLGRENKGDIEIVGIVEPNRELAERYAQQHGFSMDLVYTTIDEMLVATKPEAVTAFNTIYDHLEVVQKCAPLGIHVMVEKPLAVSLDHAKEMEQLAQTYGIHLLTNYETTWYPTTEYVLYTTEQLGEIRKVVVHDGHQGPKKIGVNEEFLEWLTDPKWNGAGALTDFGCYGANLLTAMNNNRRPISVTAITQNFQPKDYHKVDDEATIILTYPKMQGIIQASWNWTFSRKDWAVYGPKGYIKTIDGTHFVERLEENEPEMQKEAPYRHSNYADPFAYFSAVVRGEVEPNGDLSSLENNMIVMEILQTAMESARTGKTVYLEQLD